MIALICDVCHLELDAKIHLKNLNSKIRIIINDKLTKLGLEAYASSAINQSIEIISYKCENCHKTKSIEELCVFSAVTGEPLKMIDAEFIIFKNNPWHNFIQKKSDTSIEDLKTKYNAPATEIVLKLNLDEINWKKGE